ncbi:hypothetical protein ACIRL3_15625 [Streptomyces sp. NPDC102384]|uniref:hypothetical protein n=1 Tax=Streptomyces sp. NPDC102384 TaxID=3366166 RepID=UPI003817BB60
MPHAFDALRTFHAAPAVRPPRCVGDGAPAGLRPTVHEVVIVVVICVLACVLAARGADVQMILSVLGGASVLAAGTVLCLRGQDRQTAALLGHMARVLPAQ